MENIQKFVREIAFLAVLNFFLVQKIDFWPIMKFKKMEFGGKFFFVKLIYLNSRVFWHGLFKIFWPTAHCISV